MSIQTLRHRKFRSWRSESLRRKLNNRKWSCCWGSHWRFEMPNYSHRHESRTVVLPNAANGLQWTEIMRLKVMQERAACDLQTKPLNCMQKFLRIKEGELVETAASPYKYCLTGQPNVTRPSLETCSSQRVWRQQRQIAVVNFPS